jgi:hypothetical protein
VAVRAVSAQRGPGPHPGNAPCQPIPAWYGSVERPDQQRARELEAVPFQELPDRDLRPHLRSHEREHQHRVRLRPLLGGQQRQRVRPRPAAGLKQQLGVGEQAAHIALRASQAAGNPLSGRQLESRFGLSRSAAARVRQAVLAEAKGPPATGVTGAGRPEEPAGLLPAPRRRLRCRKHGNHLAEAYAGEIIRAGTAHDGTERSPMRIAEARVTLGVVAARRGDLEGAITYGQGSLAAARQSLPSLLMVSAELARTVSDIDPAASGDYLGQLRQLKEAVWLVRRASPPTRALRMRWRAGPSAG